jgi:hypothetical protein
LASYQLAGSGVQSVSIGANRFFVHVDAFPQVFGQGRAIPPNYYDIGLLRFGYQGAFTPAKPIDARDMVIPREDIWDEVGYWLQPGVLITLTEQV